MAEIRSKGAIGHIGRRRRTGSSLGKIFKNTRGSCRPRRPTPPTFFSDRFLYASSFFGALGFFSYPLAGHLPLRKGRPRCRIYEEGLGQKRGRRMSTRWNGRREMIRGGAKDAFRRKEDGWRIERRSRKPIVRG